MVEKFRHRDMRWLRSLVLFPPRKKAVRTLRSQQGREGLPAQTMPAVWSLTLQKHRKLMAVVNKTLTAAPGFSGPSILKIF